ncbi:nuclease-related domain-containing protein [Fictibacillus sp. Mic-4]|uniref:nuclease-related domain-containing protein n=1 Tax=Fictibacillus sp. Mic-4 TaxID=3132826 RepID=UPI003CE958B4
MKQRKIPIKIKKLEALLRRLPKHHPKRSEIEVDLAKSLAGYKGEQSLDYYLSFLPADEYFILHDLRLSGGNYYFQLDTFIISSSFLLILEVKNLSGTLQFDQIFHQLLRTNGEKEEVFPDPVQQVEHQRFQLKKWLENNRFSSIPIEPLVVISNPQAIIKTTSRDSRLLPPVIRNSSLFKTIHQMKEIHQEEKLSKKDIRKLCRLLLKHDIPNNPDMLERYQISEFELIAGVQCPACDAIPMERKRGKWICSHCFTSSKDAHIRALNDYVLLFQSSITNEQMRSFLKLSSPNVANKLLRQMNIPYSGTTKGRAYSLSFDE